jgi:hopanoid biosynthesis associated protein HpnK
MVAAPAAADAVARARRLPDLRVGLHLVLVDGRPVLPPSAIAGLVRGDGEFDRDIVRAGLRCFFLPHVRRQATREIRAQFEAFRATGLALDHVDGHKHIQLHPTLARLMIEIGREFGLAAMRVPAEPASTLRDAFPEERCRTPLYRPWVGHLRRRVRAAGLACADHVFGIAWSGRMTEERLARLLPELPDGVSEIYFHPAVRRTRRLQAAMPGYRHDDELAALLSPAVERRIARLGIALVGYSDLIPPQRRPAIGGSIPRAEIDG